MSVSDSGPGIPEHKLDEIFDTFYTTKEQGTGLGLSVARTIIETYDGKIWAENQAGGGAVFRFTLPLLEDTALGGRASFTSPLRPTRSGRLASSGLAAPG